MKTSLVIPCFNEAKNLPLLIDRCKDILHRREDVEIILVDNGSTDDTPKVFDELLSGTGIRFERVECNQGYGHGILAGLEIASGEVLSWTHADMQTEPGDILRGVIFFEQSSDPDKMFVKGKRYGRPMMDVLFTLGMALFETVLLRYRMWDINAQPTMFHRSFYEQWSEAPSDFSLDLYAYYLAKHNGLEIKRFPVRFGQRAHGVSHWNISWSAKIKFIKRTLGFSFELHKRLRK